MSVTVRAALAGKVTPLGRRGAPSGMDKQPVEGPIGITSVGLSGDAQGDRGHHGVPERVIHHYPFDHHAARRSHHPALAEGWTLERSLHVLYRDTRDARDLSPLAELPQLTASWRGLARRRLDTHTVENWSRRLNMPEDAES